MSDLSIPVAMWDVVKPFLSGLDVKHCADEVVSVMVDAGVDPDDIRDAFDDRAILNALDAHADDADSLDFYEDDDMGYDEDDEDD